MSIKNFGAYGDLETIITELSNKIKSKLTRQDLKDTVGWTGKNLLKNTATSQTVNGVTFTVNNDGSITANGTATANAAVNIREISESFAPPAGEYIISRGGSQSSNVQLFVNLYNGTSLVRQITNLLNVEEFRFTLDYNGYDRLVIGVYVSSGKTINNVTIYPMLRRADIADDTYEPYHESVEDALDAKLSSNSDVSNTVEATITTSSASYPEITAGETIKVIFGKIKKFLSDLKGNKTDLTNLATVEPTSTASKSYSVDDWLILNGQLYKVTAPIPSGGTITIGTNVEPTTVEDGKSSGGGSNYFTVDSDGYLCQTINE